MLQPVTEQAEQSAERTAAPTERQQATVRGFVAEHGKPVKAVIQHLGRAGARVVLVGPDGHVGDVIVGDVATGQALVADNEDVQTADWDAETVNETKIGAAHRRKMGISLTRR